MAFTITQYLMGRDKGYTVPLEVIPNATDLLLRVNELVAIFTQTTGQVKPRINSGWRTPAINAATPGAAKKSHHMTGCAIDIGDADESLDVWLMSPAGQAAMSDCGLWHEHLKHTPRWAHLQSKPYGSWTPTKSRTFSI